MVRAREDKFCFFWGGGVRRAWRELLAVGHTGWEKGAGRCRKVFDFVAFCACVRLEVIAGDD